MFKSHCLLPLGLISAATLVAAFAVAAVQWMEKPDTEESRRFRQEAEELLAPSGGSTPFTAEPPTARAAACVCRGDNPAPNALAGADPPSSEDLSAGCSAARKRATELLTEFDRGLSRDHRAAAEAAVADAAKAGRSRAEGFNAFSAGAQLAGQFGPATWGALQAALLQWRAIYVCNVGVCLFYLDRLADAERFFNCARELAPGSPYPLEALALLALKKKDRTMATKLIEQAVRMMPGDTNVLYSAGIIHFRCDNVAAARRYLRDAHARRPKDKTIEEALRVVDPKGESAPAPRPDDCLARLVNETLRSLDDSLARVDALVAFAERMDTVRKGTIHKSGSNTESVRDQAKLIRRDIERYRKEVTRAEQEARQTKPTDPGRWNWALSSCTTARLAVAGAVEGLHLLTGSFHIELYAEAFGIDPQVLLQRAVTETNANNSERTSLLWQGERRRYEEAEAAANKRLNERLNVCNKKPDKRERAACARDAGELYCNEIAAPFQQLKAASEANTATAIGMFPRAARNQVLHLSIVAGREADFIRRAAACMKPLPTGADAFYTPQRRVMDCQKFYGQVLTGCADLLRNSLTDEKRFLMDESDGIAGYVAGKGESMGCDRKGFHPKSLSEEWELILSALKEAGEYGVTPEFDCVLKLGPWSISIKESEGVNLKGSDGAWSIKGKTDLRRWGVEMAVSETANYGPVTANLGVKVWAEDRAGAPMDYGAELQTKLGLGIQKKGVGSVACYLLKGSAKVNFRVFAERLRGT